jgi:hypothetical protein
MVDKTARGKDRIDETFPSETTSRFRGRQARQYEQRGYTTTRGSGASEVSMDFHFHHDLPGHELPEEWQTMLANQVRLLNAILSRLADTVALISASPQPAGVQHLHDLLTTTEQFLTTLAQHNVSLEQEGAAFQIIGAEQRPLPREIEITRSLRVLDHVNTVFHANLTIARQYCAKTREHLARAHRETP